MSSFFRQAAQGLLNPALDSIMGERISLKGMTTRANMPPGPDPARPAVDVTGVFKWETTYARTGADERSNHHSATGGSPLGVISRKPIFSLASPGLPRIVRGDRLMRYADGTVFEVTAVEPNGVNRVCVTTAQIGLSNSGNA